MHIFRPGPVRFWLETDYQEADLGSKLHTLFSYFQLLIPTVDASSYPRFEKSLSIPLFPHTPQRIHPPMPAPQGSSPPQTTKVASLFDEVLASEAPVGKLLKVFSPAR